MELVSSFLASMVGDCRVTITPATNGSGYVITLEDIKTHQRVMKVFNPANKGSKIMRALNLSGARAEVISMHDRSLQGANWNSENVDKFGWIRFWNDKSNSEGVFSSRDIDLMFYFENKTNKIVGASFMDTSSSTVQVLTGGRANLQSHLFCGNVKTYQEASAKERFNITPSPVPAADHDSARTAQ